MTEENISVDINPFTLCWQSPEIHIPGRFNDTITNSSPIGIKLIAVIIIVIPGMMENYWIVIKTFVNSPVSGVLEIPGIVSRTIIIN
jgi:hypothetical protein